jgi:hypothetical protein
MSRTGKVAVAPAQLDQARFLREAREDEAAQRPLWRSGSGKRRAPSAASHRLAEQLIIGAEVAPHWTTDALAALVLHGYLRSDPSEVDAEGVTWRDAMCLRLASKVLRDLVDSPAFWRAQYDLLTGDKLYKPPHLDELQERGSYQEAFRLGLREALRTTIGVAELREITFFSKALAVDGVPEDMLVQHCDWWRYGQPRQQRFCGDGTVVTLVQDSSSSSGIVTEMVGHWTFASVPMAPDDAFICVVPIDKPRHTLWRIQRHEGWSVLIVGPGALKASNQMPLRGQHGRQTGELHVDEQTLMTAEDRAMLREACITMDRAASTAEYVHNAPKAFRIQELHTFPHAEVQANDVAEESDSDEGTPYS